MAAIEFQDVSKMFPDGTVAVDRLDLAIDEGEFMVFVGPSGCGKTTALRMVAGLEDISEGEITIGGRVVNDVTPRNRDIAMVFQNYALYPHMTVAANLAFGLKLRGVGKGEIGRRVHDAATHARTRGSARAQAGGAFGRPAAARRNGPCDRPRAAGVSHGRAALEPRREAACADAGGDPEPPALDSA